MKTTHTPGPWAAECPPSSCRAHRFIVAEREVGHDPIIAEVGTLLLNDDEIGIFETCANAKLIAAAPDLLAALEGLMACAARDGQKYAQEGNEPVWDLISDAQDAIAKAKGQP